MKFYTIKLPKFLGGFVRAILGSFKKRLSQKSADCPVLFCAYGNGQNRRETMKKT